MLSRIFLKNTPLSSAQNTRELKKKAKKYGVDKESLTTSMGGIETDHYELHKRVREEQSFFTAKKTYWWAAIGGLASIVTLCLALGDHFSGLLS